MAEQYRARGIRPAFAAVCSDSSAGKGESTQSLGVYQTTDPAALAEWSRRHAGQLRVYITTYHSSKALTEGLRLGGVGSVDVALLDESHHMAAKHADTFWAHLLHDKNLRIKKRLFLTATEVEYGGENKDIFCMTDQRVFGPVLDRLDFQEAVRLKIVADFRPLYLACSIEAYEQMKNQGKAVHVKELADTRNMGTLGSTLAVMLAMKRHQARRGLTFHGRVPRAKAFAADVRKLAKKHPRRFGGRVEAWAISAETHGADERARDIAKAQAFDGVSIISNCKVFTEGVDVPALDFLALMDPMESVINVTQAVGRVLRSDRLGPGGANRDKVASVLLPVGLTSDGQIHPRFRTIFNVLKAFSFGDRVAEEHFPSAKPLPPGTPARPPGEMIPWGDITAKALADALQIEALRFDRSTGADVELRFAELERNYWRFYPAGPDAVARRLPRDSGDEDERNAASTETGLRQRFPQRVEALRRKCGVCFQAVKTEADYGALAKSRGFRWEGKTLPLDSHAKTQWECSKGHRWETPYNSVRGGHGCPHCAGTSTITEADYRALAKSRDFRWRGKALPPSTGIKTQWRCSKEHRWEATYGSLQGGSGCPHCSGKAKKTEADYRALAKSRGFRWEGKTLPSNSRTKTQWACSEKHRWEAHYNSLQTGNGCPSCWATRRRGKAFLARATAHMKPAR